VPDDRDLLLADDAVAVAERAVALLQQERAERIADVEALDGTLLAAWTSLTGTREAQIEAAVAAVRQVEAHLEAATRNLARARAAVADLHDERERREVEEDARVVRREAALAAIAAGLGPFAGAVQTRLVERELLRERLPDLDEAVFAGSDLLSALNTVMSSNRLAASQQTTLLQSLQGDLGGLAAMSAEWGREAAAYDELGRVRAALAAVPERSARFAVAMAVVGREVAAVGEAEQAVSPLQSLLADGLLAEAVVWERTQIQANEFGDLASATRNQLIPVEQERRAAQARLAEIEAQLDALLAR
jgi:hypothetical protein